MGLRPDFWLPVARSRALRPGGLLPVRFAGEPIVLVRTGSGALRAFEDRCPHRQVPLHRGVVEGERLVCGYHRWAFDAAGRCVAIPQLGRCEPRGIALRRYPCREAYGLVFVFPGDPARADATPLPRVPGWDPARRRPMFFSRPVACHYSFMHENLMDMHHQFLHRRLMGSIDAAVDEEREGEDFVEVAYRLVRRAGRMRAGGGLLLGGGGPGGDGTLAHMVVRTEYPYQTLRVRRPGREEDAFYMWATYVPLDREQRTCHTLGMLLVPRPRVPGLLALFWPFMRWFSEAIFREDREAVEAEQRAWDAQGASWNREVFPAIVRLQGLLRRAGVPLDAPEAVSPPGSPDRRRARPAPSGPAPPA